MLRRKLGGLALMAALLLLTGCSGELVLDLYVQDVLDVVRGEEEYLFTTATVVMELPSDEYAQQLQGLLAGSFRGAKNFRKGSGGGYFSRFLMDVQVPVILYDPSPSLQWGEDLLALSLLPREEGLAAFGLMLNTAGIEGLFKSLSDETFLFLDSDDLSFTLRIINDLRQPVSIYLQGVYANGRPLPYAEVLTLERREAVEIKPSDVSRDYAYQQGAVLLGALQPVD
jgi:hypothetical protein